MILRQLMDCIRPLKKDRKVIIRTQDFDYDCVIDAFREDEDKLVINLVNKGATDG